MNRVAAAALRGRDDGGGSVGLRVVAGTCLLGSVIALALLLAGPATGRKAPKPPTYVEVGDTDAYINTFQALNSINEVSNQKWDDDFVRFAESLSPETLSGPEGTADASVTQASTVVTPSFSTPFQAEGVGMSGNLSVEARKNSNGAPGVPVAFADGDFEVSFGSEDSGPIPKPIPIELAGFIRTANTDAHECAQVRVEYDDGSSVRTFEAATGEGCKPGLGPQRKFQVNQTLPADAEAEIEVDSDATVAAEDPGSTESANAAVKLTLSFYPPDTRLTSAKIRAGSGKASFKFKASGNAKRLQCALSRNGKKPRFRGCRSPKKYRGLKPGSYKFLARAVGPVAPEATPAKKSFRIR